MVGTKVSKLRRKHKKGEGVPYVVVIERHDVAHKIMGNRDMEIKKKGLKGDAAMVVHVAQEGTKSGMGDQNGALWKI